MGSRSFISSHILLTALSTLFLVSRLAAKGMRRSAWALDDTLLVLALLLVYSYVAGSVIAVTKGHLGQPVSTGSSKVLEFTLFMIWVLKFPYAVSMALIRCSIAILFIRTFFAHGFARSRYIAYFSIACSIGLCVATLILNSFRCHPIHNNWRARPHSPESCFSPKLYMIATETWALILDSIIWALPHFVVWRLHLRLAHKVAISAIFALGLVNIVIGICYMIALKDAAFHGDLNYDPIPSLIWALARVSSAIILACCPLLRPVFEKVIPRGLTRIVSIIRSHPRPGIILVTTRIDIHNRPSTPLMQTVFHDGHHEPWAPTFEVDRDPSDKLKWSLNWTRVTRLCDRDW